MYIQKLKTVALGVFISCSLVVYGQNAKINFIDNDIKEAIRQAESQDKLIFIDGYATWCVPCRLMEDEVFIHPNVYQYFNENFVNLKIDLEQGVGPILSARYNAHTLPFYMFLSSDETLVYSMHGFQRIHELLAKAKEAKQPDLLRAAWDQRYKEGDRKPSFLYNYAFAIYPSPDDLHKKVVDEYLESSPDMTTARNVQFVYNFVEDVHSDLYQHLVKNQDRFVEILGKEKVQTSIDIMVDNAVRNSVPEMAIDDVAALYELSYPASGKQKALEYKLVKYDKQTESNLYTQALLEYYDLIPPDDEQLYETSKYIMQTSKDEQQLDLIENWLQELSTQVDHPEYLITRAELQIQRGDYPGALQNYKLGKKRAQQAKDKNLSKVFKAKYKSTKKEAKQKSIS